MNWNVESNHFTKAIDKRTGAEIINRVTPQIEFAEFTFSCNGNSRNFTVEIKRQSISHVGKERIFFGDGKQVAEPSLLLYSDTMNWICSEDEVPMLSAAFPDENLSKMNQFELNSKLVHYAIDGLAALNKVFPLANPPHNLFYSNYALRCSQGKSFSYQMPSDADLLRISLATA